MANYTASDEKALLRSTEAMQRVLERTIERFEEEEKARQGKHENNYQLLADTFEAHGVAVQNLNAQQLIQKTVGELNRTYKQDAEVRAAGYSSVPDLLRRHKRQLTGANAAIEAYRSELPEWAHDAPFVRYGDKEKAANREGKLDRLLLRFYPIVEEFLNTYDDDCIENLRSRWVLCETLSAAESIIRQAGADLRLSDELLEEKEKAVAEEKTKVVSVTDLITSAWDEFGQNGGQFNIQLKDDLVNLSKKEAWETDQETFNEIKQKHAIPRLGWVMRNYADCCLDSRIDKGLVLAGLATTDGVKYQYKDTVTLELYRNCHNALKQCEEIADSHEDYYEIVAHAALNPPKTYEHYEHYEDEDLESCLTTLSR